MIIHFGKEMMTLKLYFLSWIARVKLFISVMGILMSGNAAFDKIKDAYVNDLQRHKRQL